MFAFEDWSFNSNMIVHIHDLTGKTGNRVILTFHGDVEPVVFTGEQAERFVQRARAVGLLEKPAQSEKLFVPDRPLALPVR